ncbi:MAG: hypothetical protein V5B39_03080 [Accumulibacter sp.]|jgi:hypothetical protein|uniref:hypothetical protein n=1 Tax=Accumulibacter sp. TaxID=2053492 RepID=UPI002FC3686D
MHRSDKATLRLAFGLGLAAAIAYGGGLTAPYVVCVFAVVVLARPEPPLPLGKGLVAAGLLAMLVAAGIVMVPLLEHYAAAGVLLTALLLFAIFFSGQLSGSPLTMVLVIAFALVPVAGVVSQALVGALALTLATGIAVGTLVGTLSSAFFPDPPQAGTAAARLPKPTRSVAAWIAGRATVIVMPVFILALTDPSFYLAAVLKTVALGQQAGETNPRSAGRELVGSTLMGAFLAAAVWTGLSAWPNLWMLVLWLMAAGLWAGSALTGARRSRFRPSFWSNALITALILLGPAIEDSANGKSVFQGALVRTSLFVAVALYAWATIWLLERWHDRRTSSRPLIPSEEKTA